MKLIPWRKPAVEERDSYSLSFQQFVEYFNYNGSFYPVSSLKQTLQGSREEINSTFTGLATQAYRCNAVVFACMQARLAHFTEARFIYRDRGPTGRPGDLRRTPSLAILEEPWPGGTTGDLLGRMIQDVDLAGNFYAVRDGDRIARLRPDWVVIVLGSRSGRPSWVAEDPDTEVVAYLYFPGGKTNEAKPLVFGADEVCHFAPNPDPLGYRIGMSWLTALIREVQADQLFTEHKTKFVEQGATPNLIVTIPEGVSRENFNEIVDTIRQGHEGAANAYKTMFLAGGADAKAVGVDMQQMDFKAVQSAGETRIASAARVPAVIAQISEGLQGSALNSGNYQAARRMFADGELRRLWRNAAGSLAKLVVVPRGSELWYDDRDIAFLKEDLKDVAEVQQMQAAAMTSAMNAGWKPESITAWLASNDLKELKHTGLIPVQLQPDTPTPPSGGTLNGSGTLSPKALPQAT